MPRRIARLGRNPLYLPTVEEIQATAMLLGEELITCSCCIGKGQETGLWGSKRCGQCNGCGFDIIGAKTWKALDIPVGCLPHYIQNIEKLKGLKDE